MKGFFTIFPVAIVFAFVSCNKEELPISENFIPINTCQSYTVDSKKLTLCLDSIIDDSRCPVDAVCIWQGMGVARFKLNAENMDHIITLATLKFAHYNRDTTIAGFKIELINLSPQSKVNKPVSYKDYVAEVNVTKL
jgi:hypothetical protein